MQKVLQPKSTVLYADDDPDDLQLLAEAFDNFSANLKMITCRNGWQALAYLKNLPLHEAAPCLVILDINMPGKSGKEVLKDIRALDRFKDLPVVLFSTSSSPLDKEFALRYNAGYITKPINTQQMALIAGEFIDHCTEEVKQHLKAK